MDNKAMLEKVILAARAFEVEGKITCLGGNANLNFLVGEYVIKIVTEYPKENIEDEISYVTYLIDNDICVPTFKALAQGGFVYQDKEVLAVCLEKIQGSIPEVTRDVCLQIGEVFGKFHKLDAAHLTQRVHWLREDYLKKSMKLIKEHFSDDYARYEKVYVEVGSVDWRRLPQGIIHGDMSPENCIFENRELNGLLDWEECGIGASVLDLATCLHNFCVVDGKFDRNLVNAMIQGYEKERGLSDSERNVLAKAVRYAGLTLSVWRLLQFGLHRVEDGRRDEAYVYWTIDYDSFCS